MEKGFKNQTLKKAWSAVCATILVLVLIITAQAFSSKASNVFTFEGAFGVVEDNVVDYTISVSGNPGIAATVLTLEYDDSALTIADANADIVVSAKDKRGNAVGTCVANVKDGICRINWFNTANYTTDGVLLTVYFTLADHVADGKYPVTLSYDSKNLVQIPSDGSDPVTVESTGVTVGVESGRALQIGEDKPSETEPVETESAETKPVETEPAETGPVETETEVTEAEKSESTLESIEAEESESMLDSEEESTMTLGTDGDASNNNKPDTSVDTGDNGYFAEILMLLAALLGCGVIVVYRTKANRK